MDERTGSQDAKKEAFKINEAKIREHADQVVVSPDDVTRYSP